MVRTLVLFLVALPWCAGFADSVEVEDMRGRSVMLEPPAERVVVGQHFEEFIAVAGDGAVDRLVGFPHRMWRQWQPGHWAAFERAWPELNQVADVGGTEDGTFAIERVIALDADLVILGDVQYDAIADQLRHLDSAGIPVLVLDFHSQTVADHTHSIRLLGQALDETERAETLASGYAERVERVQRRLAAAAPERPAVYVEWGGHGPAQYGNSYGEVMWGPIVEHAGGRNIAAGRISSWGALEPEYVLTRDPQHIVISGAEWHDRDAALLTGFGIEPATTRARLQAFTQRTGWPALRAVAANQLHAVYQPSVRSLQDQFFIEFLAQALHPDLFADLEPAADLRRYQRRWLPIEPQGTFMYSLTAATE